MGGLLMVGGIPIAWSPDVEQPDPWRDESKQPHCGTCGHFAAKRRDPEGNFIEWYLRCVSYDYYEGGWEHD